MVGSAYATPVLVSENSSTALTRVDLGKNSAFDYDEDWLQEFLFFNPESIPVSEIDSAYETIVPICRELNTPAGPLDVLYVTPQGKLVILEAKLWRNPEARRKVVAQVLDYAKEFNRWSYEDLQREVSQKLKEKGNVIYELVKAQFPDTDEATFVDNVSRSLKYGDFLLLIVGDGIQEGTEHIADFMNTVGRLQFALGLIEVSLYKIPGNQLLVQPRVLAKTVIIERAVVELRSDEITMFHADEEEQSEEENQNQIFFTGFWKEFLEQLKLDDVSLPHSTATAQNLFFYPAGNKRSWISSYFHESKGRVGVYFRAPKGELGQLIWEKLIENREQIESIIGLEAVWEDNGMGKAKYITISMPVQNARSLESKLSLFDFFGTQVNRLNNALKPLLKSI